MKRDFTVLLAAIDFRPSVSLLVRQGSGCRLFPFGRWRLLTWGTENSKHSKCICTCEIRRGATRISLQNSASKSGFAAYLSIAILRR